MANGKLKRGDIGEEKVFEELMKFQGYQKVINNLILLGDNGVTHQLDHIVIRENGIFVIETKNYYGKLTGHEDDATWTRSFMKGRRLFSEKLNNPINQNKSHLRAVSKIIGKGIPVIGFIALVQDNADDLKIFTVANMKDITKRLSVCEAIYLTHNQIDSLYTLLLKNEAYVSTTEHVENVKKLKATIKLDHKEKRIAIETRKCPRCKSELKVSGSEYKCPKCGYTFTL